MAPSGLDGAVVVSLSSLGNIGVTGPLLSPEVG